METGKCYSLNPDRGAQYGWINNNAQDSWWWVEVPCEANDSDSDDERLLAHENRHVEIYLLEGNDEWEEKISVNSNRLTAKNSCYLFKKTFWPVMEKKYRKILKMQNAWDDADKNNVSHARINIDSLVVLQKEKWNAEPCYKENPE